MEHDRATVVSCPVGSDLLAVMAERLQAGTLIPDAVDVPLFQWRIFLPTRRAVRRLRQLLANGKCMVLPDILPIGDVDEDELAAQRPWLDIAPAISHHGLLFEVMSLLSGWAEGNTQFALAQDVMSSATRLQHLAQSLVDLLHQAETEERALSGIESVYDLDLAGHREAILDLLNVIAKVLPARLAAENRIGPSARRNLLIRAQAAEIRQHRQRKPVVIAGSTGTNPATRELMSAIAGHALGLVVLPGLASEMSAVDWSALQPTHPQFNLKILLDELQLAPDAVPDMVAGHVRRRWLMQETMRPAESYVGWNVSLRGQTEPCREALKQVRLIAAPDRHGEALTIALVLRQAHAAGKGRIGLVTPDRDLAHRVSVELWRWGLTADDTHGAALTSTGRAQLVAHIMEVVVADFAAHSLLALLHHRQADFGMAPDASQRALQLLDMHVLRQRGLNGSPAGLGHALDRATLERATAHDDEPIKAISDAAWLDLASYVARIRTAFSVLANPDLRTIADHVAALGDCLAHVSPGEPDATSLPLANVFADLTGDSHRLPKLRFAECAPLVMERMQRTNLRQLPGQSRIGIYGLLEARLMHFDLAVLGGLNEGIWPGNPDSGPWLNRPMRSEFQLQQPERDIGLTAHDFVSCLAWPDVTITWSERIGTEPAIPSRWILRLRMVMEACGLAPATHCDTAFTRIAADLDKPSGFQPVRRPRPGVAREQAPRRFSVTEIETLLRDPYAIFAKMLLRLKPLRHLEDEDDFRLRGILFHEAIRRWNESQPHGAIAAPLESLIVAGRAAFAPLADDADVQSFWWPRFLRMATWLHQNEAALRVDLQDCHAEVSGETSFAIDGEDFTIRAKADRVDVLSSGKVRIIDYKTGEPPSRSQVAVGFSPQLTLEAAMVQAGAFTRIGARATQDALYVKVSGGRVPGDCMAMADGRNGFSVSDTACEHWGHLQKRLLALLYPHCTFPPRLKPFREDVVLDYDHLSRHLEWSLTE